MDAKEIKEIFEHVDANKDGKISMAEFIEFVSSTLNQCSFMHAYVLSGDKEVAVRVLLV